MGRDEINEINIAIKVWLWKLVFEVKFHKQAMILTYIFAFYSNLQVKKSLN